MSLWTSFTDFVHNATTGELTDSQKTDIANDSINTYIPCRGNSVLPECQTLAKQITDLTNAAAPSTGCVLNIPSFGCLAKSWNTLLFSVVAIVLAVILLPTLISSAAAAKAARG